MTTTRPVRVTKRRAETRARLLAAATAVFAEHGFGQVSIEQICDAAGYSRGAFYSNFAGTDELYFALYQERATAIAEQVAHALSAAGTGRSIPELVDDVLTALTVDRQWVLIKTDFLLHAARSPQVAAVLIQQNAALRDILARQLAAAADLAALPPPLRTPDGLARAVITVHDGAMLQLLVDPDEQTLRRWLRDLLVALLAPATPPGRPPRPSCWRTST